MIQNYLKPSPFHPDMMELWTELGYIGIVWVV
jgi:hypothetical protein